MASHPKMGISTPPPPLPAHLRPMTAAAPARPTPRVVAPAPEPAPAPEVRKTAPLPPPPARSLASVPPAAPQSPSRKPVLPESSSVVRASTPAPPAPPALAASIAPPATPTMPVSAPVATASGPNVAQVMALLATATSDVESAESSLEATSLALGSVFQAFPARATIAHVVDPSSGDFVVTCALGEGADRLLMTREGLSDWVLAAAFASKRPILVEHGELGATPPERHAFFAAKRAIVVPIIAADGTPMGALEVVDPARGATLDRGTLAAVAKLAKALAGFFEERGVQLRNVVIPSGMLPPADPVSEELVAMRMRADSTPEVDPRATIPDVEVIEAIEVMRRTA